MDLKNPSTANDIAALAESLADRIEATKPGEPDRDTEYEIAALLIGGSVYSVKAHDGTVTARMLSHGEGASRSPMRVPAPWTGIARGMLRRDFATDPTLVIALADHVFDGWGWDTVKWPRGQGGEQPADGEDGSRADSAHVYDAEVTPPAEHAAAASGRSLIGQHHTMGGAMLAAILRGYAFKVKLEAGALEPLDVFGGDHGEVNFDLTEQERAFIADIVDRAEEEGISPPALRNERMLDIAAVHKNGCPLDLESFLHVATDFSFKHDFLGIVENVDRTTGKLQNEFLPRYAQVEPKGETIIAADYAAIEQRALAHMASDNPDLVGDLTKEFGGPTGRKQSDPEAQEMPAALADYLGEKPKSED